MSLVRAESEDGSSSTEAKVITIREALTEDERKAVFRLRYVVYEQERGTRHDHADHANGELRDELDDDAIVLAAFGEPRADSRPVVYGTVRFNWATTRKRYYESFYQVDLAGPWFPKATTFTTKLVVDREHRNSRLGYQLCLAVFRQGYAGGCRFNFADCNPPRLRLFERLGFRKVLPDAQHPEYGLVHRLILCLSDRAYFDAVGSPFAAALDGFPAEPDAVDHYWRKIAPLTRSPGQAGESYSRAGDGPSSAPPVANQVGEL